VVQRNRIVKPSTLTRIEQEIIRERELSHKLYSFMLSFLQVLKQKGQSCNERLECPVLLAKRLRTDTQKQLATITNIIKGAPSYDLQPCLHQRQSRRSMDVSAVR